MLPVDRTGQSLWQELCLWTHLPEQLWPPWAVRMAGWPWSAGSRSWSSGGRRCRGLRHTLRKMIKLIIVVIIALCFLSLLSLFAFGNCLGGTFWCVASVCLLGSPWCRAWESHVDLDFSWTLRWWWEHSLPGYKFLISGNKRYNIDEKRVKIAFIDYVQIKPDLLDLHDFCQCCLLNCLTWSVFSFFSGS